MVDVWSTQSTVYPQNSGGSTYWPTPLDLCEVVEFFVSYLTARLTLSVRRRRHTSFLNYWSTSKVKFQQVTP